MKSYQFVICTRYSKVCTSHITWINLTLCHKYYTLANAGYVWNRSVLLKIRLHQRNVFVVKHVGIEYNKENDMFTHVEVGTHIYKVEKKQIVLNTIRLCSVHFSFTM